MSVPVNFFKEMDKELRRKIRKLKSELRETDRTLPNGEIVAQMIKQQIAQMSLGRERIKDQL